MTLIVTVHRESFRYCVSLVSVATAVSVGGYSLMSLPLDLNGLLLSEQ